MIPSCILDYSLSTITYSGRCSVLYYWRGSHVKSTIRLFSWRRIWICAFSLLQRLRLWQQEQPSDAGSDRPAFVQSRRTEPLGFRPPPSGHGERHLPKVNALACVSSSSSSSSSAEIVLLLSTETWKCFCGYWGANWLNQRMALRISSWSKETYGRNPSSRTVCLPRRPVFSACER